MAVRLGHPTDPYGIDKVPDLDGKAIRRAVGKQVRLFLVGQRGQVVRLNLLARNGGAVGENGLAAALEGMEHTSQVLHGPAAAIVAGTDQALVGAGPGIRPDDVKAALETDHRVPSVLDVGQAGVCEFL